MLQKHRLYASYMEVDLMGESLLAVSFAGNRAERLATPDLHLKNTDFYADYCNSYSNFS